jgi:hypothetical protein
MYIYDNNNNNIINNNSNNNNNNIINNNSNNNNINNINNINNNNNNNNNNNINNKQTTNNNNNKVTCVVSSAPLRYSTPRVSGGKTSAMTGNSPLSLPPTMRKLKMPSCDVTTVTSRTSRDQWIVASFGPNGGTAVRLIELAEDRGDLRSFGDRLADMGPPAEATAWAGVAAAVLLLSMYLLGVVGRFRCFNMMETATLYFRCHKTFHCRFTISASLVFIQKNMIHLKTFHWSIQVFSNPFT